MGGLRALGNYSPVCFASFTPDSFPKLQTVLWNIEPVAFFFFLPRLNYQKAATLLERGSAGLQPLDRFISSDLSVSLPASLPLLHVSAFRPPLALKFLTSEWARAAVKINSLPHQQSMRSRSVGKREEATLLMMEEMLSHLVFSLYLAHLGLCDNISIDPNKPAPANSIMTEM